MPNREFENIDLSSICLEMPFVQDDTFAAVSADPVAAGTILGRVTADQKLIPCVLSATDGSQIPVAVMQYGFTPSGAGVEVGVRPVLSGKLRADKIFFVGALSIPLTKIEKDLLRKTGIYAVDVSQLGKFNNPGA